ncbi:hypothetical protein PHYC_02786 [Phycisphaerales bacterium]|nr:hypothetical protein PHYC_02786 [Phycisphaerales bacterium]
MTSIDRISPNVPQPERGSEVPQADAPCADPFVGLLARFTAGGREIAATARVPAGAKGAVNTPRKDDTNAQRERDRAQDRLAEAVRIAQSHEVPPSLSLGRPRDLTQLAVQKMSTARPSPHAEPESAERVEPNRAPRQVFKAREAGPEQPVTRGLTPAQDASTHPPPLRAVAAAAAQAQPPVTARAPESITPATAAQATSARAVTPTAGAGRGQGNAGGNASRTNPGTPALRALAGGTFRLSASRAGKPVPEPAQRGAMPQVVRGLALALKQGGGRVTLRLNPEQIGSVIVNVKVQGSSVTARLEASSDAAHRLLKDSVDGLRSALEARGLSVERIEIAPPPPQEASADPRDQGAPGDAGRREREGASRHAERGGRNEPAGAVEGLDAHPNVVSWALPFSVRITRDGPEHRPRLEAVA